MRQNSKLLWLVVWLFIALVGTAEHESTLSIQVDTVSSIDTQKTETIQDAFSMGQSILPTESIAHFQDTAEEKLFPSTAGIDNMAEVIPSTAGIDDTEEVIPSTEGIETIEEVIPFTDNIDMDSYSTSIPSSMVDSVVHTAETQTFTEFSLEASESITPTLLLTSGFLPSISTSFRDNSQLSLSLVESTVISQSIDEKLQPPFSTETTTFPSEAPSTSVIPSTRYVATTTSTGSQGRGLLDRLKDAPLWVWVVVAIAGLLFISCCFLMCSIAACMAKRKDGVKDKQANKNAKERRKRSLKMKKIYGELEEENNDKKKKKKSASDNAQKNQFSRFDRSRFSWSTRNSMKATSTFKPQQAQTQEMTNSSGDANRSAHYVPAPHSMTLPTNTTSSLATSSNDIQQPHTRHDTNTFHNPTFEAGEEGDRQQQETLIDDSKNASSSSVHEKPNPYW